MASQSLAPVRDEKPRRTGAECMSGLGGTEVEEVYARLHWATVYNKKAEKSKKQGNSTLISTPSFLTSLSD